MQRRSPNCADGCSRAWSSIDVNGAHFEEEIRAQPAVWARLAHANAARALADAWRDRDVLLVGSGSSLFVAQLGALALRRRGIRAIALAASEAPFDNAAYRNAAVVALSQSGQSADLLGAIDRLAPAPLIALTNTPDSPLGARADVCIDIMAGPEIAVPASKSVTAMAALVLWAAALCGGTTTRSSASLEATAHAVGEWLASDRTGEIGEAAIALARCRSVIVVGTGYGLPIAHEIALKIKEASYVHAEGFASGEFRHGSAAILDRDMGIIGIVDEASRATVTRPLDEAAKTHSARYTIGARVGDIAMLGPKVDEAFNTLAWLLTGQMLALALGRARGVDSDAPRGLTKFLG